MIQQAKMATAAIVLIFMASAVSYANNQIDPAQYPETITVMAESKETATKDLGTTFTHKPKTNILGRPETDIVGRPTGASTTIATTHVEHSTYCQAHGTIKDITYVMNGRTNAPCIPFGTFKAKITKGQYIDVLVTEPNGNQYSVGFEIVQAERAPVNDEAKPVPQASAPVVAAASQIQPQPTSTVPPAVSQPQPATADVAPKPDVSVAEAARQAVSPRPFTKRRRKRSETILHRRSSSSVKVPQYHWVRPGFVYS
jgi:hypothetical protein